MMMRVTDDQVYMTFCLIIYAYNYNIFHLFIVK